MATAGIIARHKPMFLAFALGLPFGDGCASGGPSGTPSAAATGAVDKAAFDLGLSGGVLGPWNFSQ